MLHKYLYIIVSVYMSIFHMHCVKLNQDDLDYLISMKNI